MPYDSKGLWYTPLRPQESLQDSLEQKAFFDAKRKNFGAVDPVRAAVVGTNASPEFTLGMVPKTYYVPNKDLNAAGWTNANGETFVTPHRMPNTAGHEAFHSRMTQMPGKGMPYAGGIGTTEDNARTILARNMQSIQPDSDTSPPNAKWGLDPNRNAEEQIANLRGYESSLPAGTPITKTPIAPKLFSTEGYPLMNPNALKDYYFEKSSLPYKGMWDQPIPQQGFLDNLRQRAGQWMTKFGLNTVNRGNPNE